MNESTLEVLTPAVLHDLRSPLIAIYGFSNALIEDIGETLDEQSKDFLSRIIIASQKMEKLMDSLSKLYDLKEEKIFSEKVDLSLIAKDIVKNIPNSDFAFNIMPDLYAQGDSSLLKIVLECLFQNAWKFKSKSAEPYIEFGSYKDQGSTIYYVKDNGVGFDMENSNKLFQSCGRLHSKHEFPGNGMGLMMVKTIILKHGGNVWAEGKENEGATFFFTLGKT